MMSASSRILVPSWRYKIAPLLIFARPSRRNVGFIVSSMKDDNAFLPKQNQVGYDSSSEELFGLEVELQPRNLISAASKPRSWFGPNGQYIRELPCPTCRGRGYTPCPECGIERSRVDCPQCNGKGITTCPQCLGDCVTWEEVIDERPWEKARAVSPLKVKEDDEVDNLDIKLDVRKKSKRVYQSLPPEVGLKISRSLKILNARTGLFSNRMKLIHRDPTLHAQRVAAIKKAKRTPAARKRASEASKAFFSDPENRRKRSLAMKGVKFYCSNCGREGHRSFYCPELQDASVTREFRCRLCGETGHNRRTCKNSKAIESKSIKSRPHRCKTCHQIGHNSRTCRNSTWTEAKSNNSRPHHCTICHQTGHNRITCPQIASTESTSGKDLIHPMKRIYICKLCLRPGHNSRTCPNRNKSSAVSELMNRNSPNMNLDVVH